MNRGFVNRHTKALLRLGLDCNNRCLFCHARGATAIPATGTSDAARRIAAAAGLGVDMVVFSGGEPTVRKDIARLFKVAAELKLATGLITNGRMLSYEHTLRAFMDCSLAYILVSLHGADARVHDRLAGAESFSQTLEGLENVARANVQRVVNTVLTRDNADDLPGILERIRPFAPIHYKISIPEPKGALLENFDLVLPPDKAADVINNFIAAHAHSRNGVSIGVDGLCPCLLKDYFQYNDDLFTHGFQFVNEPHSPEFFAPDHGKRSFTDSCLQCSYFHLCPGLYAEYVTPETRLEPLREPVSNSICFSPVRDIAMGARERPCIIKNISMPEPARWLALRDRSGLHLYQTNEIQSSIPELIRTKIDFEQVYLNTGEHEDSLIPDHLVKMTRIKECRSCKHVACCPGVFVQARQQPFENVQKDLFRLFASVSGRVCEIGPGDRPFFEWNRDAAHRESISFYMALEPHHEMPEYNGREDMRIIGRCLEDYDVDEAPFNFVLMLRSYHHIRDLQKGMRILEQLVKPGGRLIVTENFRNIELMGDEPPARDQKEKDFCHFRNHSVYDAQRVFEAHGFKAVEIIPMTFQTANHWSLVLENTGRGRAR